MLEAVNENRTDCFGWALGKAVEDGLGKAGNGFGKAEDELEKAGDGLEVVAKREPECRHHHGNRRSLLGVAPPRQRVGVGGKRGESGAEDGLGQEEEEEEEEDHPQSGGKRRWSWWPSWYELRTHYFRDIGFVACLTQMIAATIFWISGIVGVPSILGGLSTSVENGIYWVPQVSSRIK